MAANSPADPGEQVSVAGDARVTCLDTVRWGGRRYRIERGWERWYVDVCSDGSVALATGFRDGRELDGMPQWVYEVAQEIAPGGEK